MALIGRRAPYRRTGLRGLNNVGASGEYMIVLLNDNGMSIDPNVGALPNHLSKPRKSKPCPTTTLEMVSGLFGESPSQSAIYQLQPSAETSLKKDTGPGSTLFEDMGFTLSWTHRRP